jgi:hypothetical protein
LIGAWLGGTLMELAGGQSNYRQLAEEIGEVLQTAAETAERMQEDARVEAARIRAEAEAELRVAYAEGRRVLDDARMESDMVRAEAEWQAQEIIAQARRHAAERTAGADSRLAELQTVESRVLDRLAGVGQVLADSLAALREGPAIADIAATPAMPAGTDPYPDADGADDDHPTGKVYFVEFPPHATPAAPAAHGDPEAEQEIILSESSPGASLFVDDEERSEWAPPSDLPNWWTRGGVQG